jgi:RNA recognition motif. (a.k.a. RRM, RBD, or RNP domain)
MSATLYIDGFLASISELELKGMFSKFGNVLTIETGKAHTPQSVTVGKVEMETCEEARRAAQALHRSNLGGKLLLVFL